VDRRRGEFDRAARTIKRGDRLGQVHTRRVQRGIGRRRVWHDAREERMKFGHGVMVRAIAKISASDTTRTVSIQSSHYYRGRIGLENAGYQRSN